MKDNIVANLPMGAKPMDPTRKNWVNYDWLSLKGNLPKKLSKPKTTGGKVDEDEWRLPQYECGVVVSFVLKQV